MSVPDRTAPDPPTTAEPLTTADAPRAATADVPAATGDRPATPAPVPNGVPGALDAITEQVAAWDGITAVTGGRGEWSFRLGRREIGHLHGDRVLHIAFPKAVWHELHDAGRITFHPVFPDRVGWAARAIRDEDDVRDVVALLRTNYDRERERHPASAD